MPRKIKKFSGRQNLVGLNFNEKSGFMPNLFENFTVKSLTLKNRIVMPPMCMYTADSNGFATLWHKIHYSTRAVGNAGLIIQEATSVEKRGRLSDNDLGIWSDDHIASLADIVDAVHKFGSKIAIQIAHGGRKAWTGADMIVAPSPIKFSTSNSIPYELTKDDIKHIILNFAKAASRAVSAGYDAVEIHGAHGYLIHQFISPYSNKRNDEYGNSRQNRLRFAKEIIDAVKASLPSNIPLLIRISAVEYIEDGYTFDDMIEACEVFKKHGVDMIDVSSGGASPVLPIVYPGYQLPYAQRIRSEVHLPVIGCGLITDSIMANEAVSNEFADLIAVGRGMLGNPYWATTAAKELKIAGIVPKQYKMAYPQDIW